MEAVRPRSRSKGRPKEAESSPEREDSIGMDLPDNVPRSLEEMVAELAFQRITHIAEQEREALTGLTMEEQEGYDDDDVLQGDGDEDEEDEEQRAQESGKGQQGDEAKSGIQRMAELTSNRRQSMDLTRALKATSFNFGDMDFDELAAAVGEEPTPDPAEAASDNVLVPVMQGAIPAPDELEPARKRAQLPERSAAGDKHDRGEWSRLDEDDEGNDLALMLLSFGPEAPTSHIIETPVGTAKRLKEAPRAFVVPDEAPLPRPKVEPRVRHSHKSLPKVPVYPDLGVVVGGFAEEKETSEDSDQAGSRSRRKSRHKHKHRDRSRRKSQVDDARERDAARQAADKAEQERIQREQERLRKEEAAAEAEAERQRAKAAEKEAKAAAKEARRKEKEERRREKDRKRSGSRRSARRASEATPALSEQEMQVAAMIAATAPELPSSMSQLQEMYPSSATAAKEPEAPTYAQLIRGSAAFVYGRIRTTSTLNSPLIPQLLSPNRFAYGFPVRRRLFAHPYDRDDVPARHQWAYGRPQSLSATALNASPQFHYGGVDARPVKVSTEPIAHQVI